MTFRLPAHQDAIRWYAKQLKYKDSEISSIFLWLSYLEIIHIAIQLRPTATGRTSEKYDASVILWLVTFIYLVSHSLIWHFLSK